VIDRDFVAWCDAGAFMVESSGQRRFRLSIRTLMIAVALCAVLLALAIWTVRHFEARVRVERLLAEQARAQALLARDLAQAELVAAKLGTADQSKAGSLWAGLSVNHPIFKAGQTKDLRIEVSLVNDSDKVIDPKIADSQIVINGKESIDSGLIFSSVQKGARSRALSPGDSLQFSLPLGDQFKGPGTYRISWKGSGFHSPEIVLRILPEGAR
jgi:hypothetical protein